MKKFKWNPTQILAFGSTTQTLSWTHKPSFPSTDGGIHQMQQCANEKTIYKKHFDAARKKTTVAIWWSPPRSQKPLGDYQNRGNCQTNADWNSQDWNFLDKIRIHAAHAGDNQKSPSSCLLALAKMREKCRWYAKFLHFASLIVMRMWWCRVWLWQKTFALQVWVGWVIEDGCKRKTFRKLVEKACRKLPKNVSFEKFSGKRKNHNKSKDAQKTA